MPKLKDETAFLYRYNEHQFASDVLIGSYYVKQLALIELRRIAQKRAFLTQSPINAALVALHDDSLSVQNHAAQILLYAKGLNDPRVGSAIRLKLQTNPHTMVASILKEALSKVRKRKKSNAA